VQIPATLPAEASAPPVVQPSAEEVALSEKLQSLQIKKHLFNVILSILKDFNIYKPNPYTEQQKALIGTHVIEGMLAENFELIKYAPNLSLKEEQLVVSQLRGWDRHTGNDVFQAKYKGITFTFSNIRLLRGARYGGPTVSKGQWLILDLHKENSTPLMISTLEKRGGFVKEARVKVKPEGISERFTLLTEAPETIPQILPPDFIEFLITPRHPLGHKVSYHEIHVFFGRTQVYIGLQTHHDLFELGDDMRDIPAFRRRVQKEINYIKSTIKAFSLIESLFGSEESDKGNNETSVENEPT